MTSRRKFLTHSCSLGFAAATASTTALSLGFARQAAAQSLTDYRALVCILLAGGNDSFNMVVPNDFDQYPEYLAIRSDLALEQSVLLPLSGTASNGRNYALHPGMPEVQSLFANGDAALIANVGTLIEPVDAGGIEYGTAKLPLGLYSHADQIAQWQTALPDARVAEGWGGRVADLMQNVNLANGVSMNISLSGTNVFQSGKTATEYSITAEGDGAIGINAYDDGSEFGAFRKRMVDDLLAVQQRNIFRREYANRLRRSIDAQAVFVDALTTSAPPATPFSENYFS